MFLKLTIIALGGAFGSCLRYVLVQLSKNIFSTSFPIGTLLVNTIGCFLMGICASILIDTEQAYETQRLALMVGLLGGFTTFSAFSWETLSLFNHGEVFKAALNVICSNCFSLFAVWLGYRSSQFVLGA